MYVITFYSFKGGVGRTMALVNVAAELVRRGRKVLVVDFDLEAPGLETYKQLQPKQPHPGIVEYVTEFRRSQEVPDLREYIYEAKPIGKQGGRLWVMPAGRRDRAYRNALTDLDWKRLYQDEGGFLLFEDTKKGWEKELKPDYVLIDSRTGDTDVLGICTRQLPDAVVLMFMPNDQNLAGLKNVVRDIRREETEGLKKKIQLHFVAANVPRLDDEEGILQRRLRRFGKALGFHRPDAVIDRYDSLLHLDQRVFVLERPRSRLAKQYRRLIGRLITRNLKDREGQISVLDWLRRGVGEGRLTLRLLPNRPAERLVPAGFDSPRALLGWGLDLRPNLERITEAFPDDQEMLMLGAEIYSLDCDFEAADALLDKALGPSLGDNPKARLLRSRVRFQLGRKELAVDDLIAAIHAAKSPGWLVINAIRDLRRYDPRRLQDVAWEPLHALPTETKVEVAGLLATPADSFGRATALLEEARTEVNRMGLSEDALFLAPSVLSPLSIYLLYRREWTRLVDVANELMSWIPASRWPEEFHFALAQWGLTGEMPKQLCQALAGFSPGFKYDDEEGYADDYQALALVYWRIGDRARAKECVREAQRRVDKYKSPQLSYWRCLEVSPEEFREDCRQIERLIDGEPLKPLFLASPARPPTDKPTTA